MPLHAQALDLYGEGEGLPYAGGGATEALDLYGVCEGVFGVRGRLRGS